MSDSQYNQYTNLFTFAKEWRKFDVTSQKLSADKFRGEMQTEQYVRIDCVDGKKNRNVLIYLFDKKSKYVMYSQDLKRLLKKVKEPCRVLLITHKPFNTYCRKALNTFKHLNISSYRHEIFDLIVPHGPGCYPHRVMSREEVLRLLNEELCCYLTNLPRIFDEDPQCIWIGAEVGDVVEITMLSDISGETIQYRVVVPKSGRIISFKDTAQEDESDKKISDEVDDEVAAYQEDNASADEAETSEPE